MLSIQTMMLFLLASLSLSLLPGPDMLYIIARTISYDKKAGLISTLGISTGLIFHTMAAASGLSLILLQSAVVFTVIKFFGAGYLIFLGIKMLLVRKHNCISELNLSRINPFKLYQQGFITNLLNPKVAIFFMAFLPQFVHPDQGRIFWQFVLLGFLFILTGTMVNVGVALLSSKLKNLVVSNNIGRSVQEKITGLLLIGIGIKIATISHK